MSFFFNFWWLDNGQSCPILLPKWYFRNKNLSQSCQESYSVVLPAHWIEFQDDFWFFLRYSCLQSSKLSARNVMQEAFWDLLSVAISRFSQFQLFRPPEFTFHLDREREGTAGRLAKEKLKWLKGHSQVHNDDTLLGPRAYFNPIALEVRKCVSLKGAARGDFRSKLVLYRFKLETNFSRDFHFQMK